MERKLIKTFVSELKARLNPFCENKEILYSAFNRFLLEQYVLKNSLFGILDYIKSKMPEIFNEKIDDIIKNINLDFDNNIFKNIEVFDLCFQYYNFDEEGYYKKTQFYTPKNIAVKICENLIQNGAKCILEPACGSGALLREIYNRCSALKITSEIEAYELDKRAIQLAQISYTLNAYKENKCKVFIVIQNKDFLLTNFSESRKFDCIIANPPFLGRKYMPKNYTTYLKCNYPNACENLAYGFLTKSISLLESKCTAGFIVPDNYLYLENTNNLKIFLETNFIVKHVSIEGEFKDIYGSKFSPEMVYIENEKPEKTVDKEDKSARLSDIATVVTGIQTGNNKKYVKHFSEIPQKDKAKEIGQKNKKWYPYLKGGGYKKWSGNDEYFVFFENKGEKLRKEKGSIIRNEKYFEKEGITYSYYSENRFSARYKDKGTLFDIGGACLFFNDESDLFYTLALLNSSVACSILTKMNPTMSFQTSTIKNFPLITKNKDKIVKLSKKAVELSKKTDKFFITSKHFKTPDFIGQNGASFKEVFIKSEEKLIKLKNSLENIENIINNEFENIYQLYDYKYYKPKKISHKILRKKLADTFLKWLDAKNYEDVLEFVKLNYPKTYESDLIFISKILNGKLFNNPKIVIERELQKI